MPVLTHISALCGIPDAGALGAPALLLALFLAGLTGSGLHCVPMCGPFVLGQVAGRLARTPTASLCEMTRLRGALLLPYHAGRLITYALLGAAAGTLGWPAAWPGWLPAALLAGAGGLFAMQAVRRFRPARPCAARPAAKARQASAWSRLLVRLAGRIDRTRWTGGLLLGLLLGFLPCGLLYTALLAASAAGSATAGAAAMAAFALGTVPALVLTGLAGHAARARWRWPGVAGALVMALNAGVLWAMAGRMLVRMP